MAIAKKWSSFNNEIVTEIENVYAVYELAVRSKDIISKSKKHAIIISDIPK